MTHAFTQSSQPQHEPVAHSAQTFPASHPTLGSQIFAQVLSPHRQVSPFGHGSFASQCPFWIGTHADAQSLQVGHDEVAQP